jgi:hypothetical protein
MCIHTGVNILEQTEYNISSKRKIIGRSKSRWKEQCNFGTSEQDPQYQIVAEKRRTIKQQENGDNYAVN